LQILEHLVACKFKGSVVPGSRSNRRQPCFQSAKVIVLQRLSAQPDQRQGGTAIRRRQIEARFVSGFGLPQASKKRQLLGPVEMQFCITRSTRQCLIQQCQGVTMFSELLAQIRAPDQRFMGLDCVK